KGRTAKCPCISTARPPEDGILREAHQRKPETQPKPDDAGDDGQLDCGTQTGQNRGRKLILRNRCVIDIRILDDRKPERDNDGQDDRARNPGPQIAHRKAPYMRLFAALLLVLALTAPARAADSIAAGT